MRMTTDTLYNAGCGDAPAPGGIPRARLAWLCQPEQIERTLRLLSSLNHWAKARERLLYADRQGLYRVKAALVQQAFAAGLISPVSYTDGSAALDLFARITGRRPACRADIEALDVEGTKTFLQERPAALVTQARATRLPIPDGELEALCIEPVDRLDIRWSRDRPSPRWCELDESETVQLDPEGHHRGREPGASGWRHPARTGSRHRCRLPPQTH